MSKLSSPSQRAALLKRSVVHELYLKGLLLVPRQTYQDHIMGPAVCAITFCLDSDVPIHTVQASFRRMFEGILGFKTKVLYACKAC